MKKTLSVFLFMLAFMVLFVGEFHYSFLTANLLEDATPQQEEQVPIEADFSYETEEELVSEETEVEDPEISEPLQEEESSVQEEVEQESGFEEEILEESIEGEQSLSESIQAEQSEDNNQLLEDESTLLEDSKEDAVDQEGIQEFEQENQEEFEAQFEYREDTQQTFLESEEVVEEPVEWEEIFPEIEEEIQQEVIKQQQKDSVVVEETYQEIVQTSDISDQQEENSDEVHEKKKSTVTVDKELKTISYDSAGVELTLQPKTGNYRAEVTDGKIEFIDEDNPHQMIVYHYLEAVEGPDGELRPAQKEWILLLEQPEEELWSYDWTLENHDFYEVSQDPETYMWKILPIGYGDEYAFYVPRPFYLDAYGNKFFDVSLSYEEGLFSLQLTNVQAPQYPIAIDPTFILPIGAVDDEEVLDEPDSEDEGDVEERGEVFVDPVDLPASLERAQKLPMAFEPYQNDQSGLRYSLSSDQYQMGFYDQEVRYDFYNETRDSWDRYVQRFVGAQNAELKGELPLEGKVNRFIGSDASQWETNLPTYSRIRYEDLYEGVDLVYVPSNGSLKYQFEVDPKKDFGQIEIEYRLESSEGQALPVNLRVNDAGQLVVEHQSGELVEEAPFVYQIKNGKKVLLSSAFELRGSGRVGFSVQKVDPAYPLIIDPQLNTSSYLGSALEGESARVFHVDSFGAMYLFSQRDVDQNPTPVSGSGTSFTILKMNPSASAVLFSITLGGTNGTETISDAYVDQSGNILVSGITISSDFPLVDEIQGSKNGVHDAFISKISADGSSLLFSTYFGGSNFENPKAITADASNNIYVAGETYSTDFPTLNPFQASMAGGTFQDLFYAKILSSDNTLAYSSYLGGTDVNTGDELYDIIVDSSNRLHIAGRTDVVDFPLQDPIQTHQGDTDGFVTRVAADGQSLSFSTYVGGSAFDEVRSITFDDSGRIVVAGSSASADYPSVGAFQGSHSALRDATITVLNAGLTAYDASTYLGGSSTDYIQAILLDSLGQLVAVGLTSSSDFPTKNSFPASGVNPTAAEVFVSILSGDLSSLVLSSFQGGTGFDRPDSAVIDSNDVIYVGGYTDSNDFRTKDPFQATRNNNSDGFFFSFERLLVPEISGEAGDGEIVVNAWEALDGVDPADGGAAITDYLFEVAEDSNFTVPVAFADAVSATPAQTTISGLTNGTTYYVRIRAVSGFGNSAYSNVLSLTPQASVVDLEIHVFATDSTNSDTLVTGITDSVVGGANDFTSAVATSAAENYTLARSYDFVDGNSSATETDLGVPALRTLVAGASTVNLADDDISADIFFPFPVLLYGVEQTKFRILSNGAIVTGGPDDTITTTSDGCCNGFDPIENQTVTDGDDFFIALIHSDLNPSDGNSGPIEYGLNIADSDEFVIFFNDVEGYNTGAVNGGYSAQVIFRRYGAATPLPGQVTNLIALPGNQKINISFDVPIGSDPVVSDLIVEVDAGQGFVVYDDGVSTDATVTISGLTNGVPHAVRVKARNANGDGPYSVVAVATPTLPNGRVEIHVFETGYAGNTMYTGVADHVNGGGNDISSFASGVDYAGPNAAGAEVARAYSFFPGSASVEETVLAQATRRTLSAPTTLTLSDDDLSFGVALPFDVNVYGEIYDTITVSSNGFVYGAGANGNIDSFRTGASSSTLASQQVTDTDDHLFAGVWHDLNPDDGGTITHGVVGTAPNREYVVDFSDVRTYDDPALNSFQIVFFESAFATQQLTVSGESNPTDLLVPASFQAICDPTAGADLENYRLQVSRNAGFTDIAYDSGATVMAACAPGAASPSFSVPELIPDGTTYYWRIKFWTAVGSEAAASYTDGTSTLTFFADIQPPVGTIELTGAPAEVTDPLVDFDIRAYDVNGHGNTASGGVAGGIAAYQLSNDGVTFAPEVLVPFPYTNGGVISVTDWDITDPAYGGDDTEGNKTVYVKLRDRVGNLSNSTWTQSIDADFQSGTLAGGTISNDQITLGNNGLGNPNTWTDAGLDSLPAERRGAASGVINGKLYVAGGEDSSVDNQDSLYIFDPTAPVGSRWTTGPSMPAERAFFDGVVYNDMLYVFGGTDIAGNSHDDVYRFNPAANGGLGQWDTLTPSGVDRNLYGSALIGDNWYIFGGEDGVRRDEVLRYNIPGNNWQTVGLTDMPANKSGHTAEAIGTSAYVFGGSLGDTDEVLIFNPAGNAGAGSWTSGTDSPNDHSFACSVVQGSEVVVISNVFNGNVTLVDTFDPTGNGGLGSWSTAFVDLPSEQTGCTAEIVANTIVVSGGIDNGTRLNRVLYGPSDLGTNATFTSSVFDAHSQTEFTDVTWNKTIPANTSITMEYRACDLSDCSDGVFSSPVGTDAVSTLNFSETNKRYFQWRAVLAGDSTATPVLNSVAVEYDGTIAVVFPFAPGGGGGNRRRIIEVPPADPDPTPDPTPEPTPVPPNDSPDPTPGPVDPPTFFAPPLDPPDEDTPPEGPPYDFTELQAIDYQPSARSRRSQELLYSVLCLNTIVENSREYAQMLADFQFRKKRLSQLPESLQNVYREVQTGTIYKPTLIQVFADLAPDQLQSEFNEVVEVLRKADEPFYDLAELSKVIVLSTTICESNALRRREVQIAQEIDAIGNPEWFIGYLEILRPSIEKYWGDSLVPWTSIQEFSLISILEVYVDYIFEFVLLGRG